jgi:hypothetical protein
MLRTPIKHTLKDRQSLFDMIDAMTEAFGMNPFTSCMDCNDRPLRLLGMSDGKPVEITLNVSPGYVQDVEYVLSTLTT